MQRFYLSLALLLIPLLLPASTAALTLAEVLKHTLDNNPDLLAARAQVLSREKQIRGAKAAYYPTLDAELGIGREWTQSPATGDEEIELTRKEAALRLRQMVYDGSAAASEIDRQKARYNSALFDTIAEEENLPPVPVLRPDGRGGGD
ncbi:MAG: TolC family protein [Pseudomonadota bacterium]